MMLRHRFYVVLLAAFCLFDVDVAFAERDVDKESCGPITLKVICRCLGRHVTLDEAAALLGTSEGNTTLAGFRRAVEDLGFHARAYRLRWEDLRRLTSPAVLVVRHSDRQHAVTLAGVGEDAVFIIDPFGPSGWRGKEPLFSEDSWDGTALLVSRSEKRTSPFDSFSRAKAMSALAVLSAVIIAGTAVARRARRSAKECLLAVCVAAGVCFACALGTDRDQAGAAGAKEEPPGNGVGTMTLEDAGRQNGALKTFEGPVGFKNACVSLGEAKAGQILSGKLHLRNRGKSPAKILGVRSTCACVTVDAAGDVIPPGGTLALDVTVTSHESGTRKDRVFVVLEDVVAPVTCSILSKFRKVVFLYPPIVALSGIDPRQCGESDSGGIFDAFSKEEDTHIELAKVDARLRVEQIKPDGDMHVPDGLVHLGRYRVFLSQEGRRSAERFRASVEFEVSETDPDGAQALDTGAGTSAAAGIADPAVESEPTISRLIVDFDPVEEVKALPDTLAFVPSADGSAAGRRVILRGARESVEIERFEHPFGQRLSVEIVETDTDDAAFEVTPGGRGDAFEGVLKVFLKGRPAPVEIRIISFR